MKMSDEEVRRRIETGSLIPVKRWVAYSVIFGFIGGIVIWLVTVITWITGVNVALASQTQTDSIFEKRVDKIETRVDAMDDNQKLIIANLRSYIISHGGTWITTEMK